MTERTDMGRFIDSEKWRETYAGVGVEELVRTFDYKEKPEVFKYYPQYYHKTDKVRYCNPDSLKNKAQKSTGWPPGLH